MVESGIILIKYWLEVERRGADPAAREPHRRPAQDLEAVGHGPEVLQPLVRLLPGPGRDVRGDRHRLGAVVRRAHRRQEAGPAQHHQPPAEPGPLRAAAGDRTSRCRSARRPAATEPRAAAARTSRHRSDAPPARDLGRQGAVSSWCGWTSRSIATTGGGFCTYRGDRRPVITSRHSAAATAHERQCRSAERVLRAPPSERWAELLGAGRSSISLPLMRVVSSRRSTSTLRSAGSSTSEWSILMAIAPKSPRDRPPSLASAPTIWRGSTF